MHIAYSSGLLILNYFILHYITLHDITLRYVTLRYVEKQSYSANVFLYMDVILANETSLSSWISND